MHLSNQHKAVPGIPGGTVAPAHEQKPGPPRIVEHKPEYTDIVTAVPADAHPHIEGPTTHVPRGLVVCVHAPVHVPTVGQAGAQVEAKVHHTKNPP